MFRGSKGGLERLRRRGKIHGLGHLYSTVKAFPKNWTGPDPQKKLIQRLHIARDVRALVVGPCAFLDLVITFRGGAVLCGPCSADFVARAMMEWSRSWQSRTGSWLSSVLAPSSTARNP